MWTVFPLNVILLSLLRVAAERRRASDSTFGVLLNFVNATPVTLENAKRSKIFISLLVLATNFFLGKFFNNDVTSQFLNPTEPFAVSGFIRCPLNARCPKRLTILYGLLELRSAVCGLDDAQILFAGLPLRKIRYRDLTRANWSIEGIKNQWEDPGTSFPNFNYN